MDKVTPRLPYSSDSQRYALNDDGIGLRILSNFKDKPQLPNGATPIEARVSAHLQCSRCYSESKVDIFVGQRHGCDICGQTFADHQIDAPYSKRIAYPFSRVMDLGQGLCDGIPSNTSSNRKHLFGQDFNSDLKECISRFGNVLSLEMGDLENEYYFLSRFFISRYAIDAPTTFILKLYFFYEAYRALDHIGGGWPRSELLHLGRELASYIAIGIPLADQPQDAEEPRGTWAVANAIAAPILLMAYTRLKEIYGESAQSRATPTEDLEYWCRLLFPIALGQFAADDRMYVPIRLFATTALIWSAYSGWIPKAEAGMVSNICEILGTRKFERDPDDADVRFFRPFEWESDAEFDLDDVLTLLTNGLIGHIRRRQVQTRFYANVVFARSFLLTPEFTSHLLDDEEDTRTREERKTALADIFVERMKWIYEKLSAEPERWMAGRRSIWAVEAGRLAWSASRAFLHNTEFRAISHELLEGACIFVLRDEFLLVPQDRLLVIIERSCATLNALSVYYASIGWQDEALSLMGFYRGWAIRAHEHDRFEEKRKHESGERPEKQSETMRVMRLFSNERSQMLHRVLGVHPLIAKTTLGMSANFATAFAKAFKSLVGLKESETNSSELRVFRDDFDDPEVYRGVEERLRRSPRPALIVSITWTHSPFANGNLLVAAILCAGGSGIASQWKTCLWQLTKQATDALAVLDKISPSSFREKRLKKLAESTFEHLIEPLLEQAKSFSFSEIGFCGPGTLAVLPLESAFLNAGFPLLPVAIFPSLQPLRPTENHRTDKLKITVLAFTGSSLTGTELEADAINRLSNARIQRIECAFLTKEAILETLGSGADILHCCAHGKYIDDSPDDSELIFGDELEFEHGRIRAGDIAIDANISSETLVILSACSSALLPDDLANSWRGLAGAFLRAGAAGVIAARWAVSDRAAAALFTDFYLRLEKVSSPSVALCEAKETLRLQGFRLEEWDCFCFLSSI